MTKNELKKATVQFQSLDPSKHRQFVYRQIFKGMKFGDEEMFLNPGYRGVEVMPYPEGVKQMIKAVNTKVQKLRPDIKQAIYRGLEVEPLVDKPGQTEAV